MKSVSRRSYRLRANNLAKRLKPGSFAEAAFAGLQDSAPRAAQVSLYARVENVEPNDWDHSSLVQTWAPRGAVFVVAKKDLPVFARGIVPRDSDQRDPLQKLADKARRFVEDTGSDQVREVANHLGEEGGYSLAVRLAVAIAGLPIRWDARTTSVLPPLRIDIDDEDARLELARRFLRSLGPADPRRFARWAGVSDEDAAETFQQLETKSELMNISVGGTEQGWLLDKDVDLLMGATPVKSVRLLPFGSDPVLQPGDQTIGLVRVSKGRTRLEFGDIRFDLPRWALGGAVLLDENLVASWGRRTGKVVLMPFRPLSDSDRRRIEAEAGGLRIPGVDSISITWRDPERG